MGFRGGGGQIDPPPWFSSTPAEIGLIRVYLTEEYLEIILFWHSRTKIIVFTFSCIDPGIFSDTPVESFKVVEFRDK